MRKFAALSLPISLYKCLAYNKIVKSENNRCQACGSEKLIRLEDNIKI